MVFLLKHANEKNKDVNEVYHFSFEVVLLTNNSQISTVQSKKPTPLTLVKKSKALVKLESQAVIEQYIEHYILITQREERPNSEFGLVHVFWNSDSIFRFTEPISLFDPSILKYAPEKLQM